MATRTDVANAISRIYGGKRKVVLSSGVTSSYGSNGGPWGFNSPNAPFEVTVQYTNLFGSPNDISLSPWSIIRATATAGGTASQGLLETAVVNTHLLTQVVSKSAVTRNYRMQFDVKADLGRDWFRCICFNQAFDSGIVANFNITAGTLGTTYGYGSLSAYGAFSMTNLGGGVWRCIRDWTHDASVQLNFQISPCTADETDNYLGDITKGIRITNPKLYQL